MLREVFKLLPKEEEYGKGEMRRYPCIVPSDGRKHRRRGLSCGAKGMVAPVHGEEKRADGMNRHYTKAMKRSEGTYHYIEQFE